MTQVMAIAGASGVVGRHLVDMARRDCWAVRVLTHSQHDAGLEMTVHRWDPAAVARGEDGALDPVVQALDGADLVVNLAGSSLAEGRLGEAHRRRVLVSRLDATQALARAHERCQAPPPCWVQASALGYYGDCGEAEVTEEHPRGSSFLSEVCERWEAAARQVQGRTRLVLLRIGLVLAADAPAFRQLLTPVLWGVGGPLGSGEQWWSWIDADDLSRAILFLAGEPRAVGAFNMIAPEPVRQADLVRGIATCVGRPAMFRAPAWALRCALGAVADELLLPSCRASPRRLQALGFRFRRPTVGRALVDIFDALDRD